MSKLKFLRPRTHRFALESRQLFDGAAFVEAAAQADAAPAEVHHAPAAEPPTQVQPAPHEAPAESATAEPTQPAATAPHEVYVVDQNIANWQQLAASVPPGAQLVLLDSGSSGVQQLADALSGQTGITALHILSHGSTGEITLGNEQVDLAGLDRSAVAWRTIGASLSADADILLYGCDVAADGAQFSQALGNLTGADVASSTDATGSAARGADWTLESSTGHIEARSFADADFDGVMAAPTVTTTATRLTVAEPSSLNAPGADRATLSGWTIADDGSGNVTVTVVVEDPTVGTLSSASTTGVSTIAGGYSFTGSVAAANAWVNQLVFTSADVELGTTAASTRIVVSVTDSEAPALTANHALDVTVTPSNDPVAVADAAQAVNEIGSTVLTVGALNALDAEVALGTQVPSQVVYALTAEPVHGYLTVNGTRLGVGGVFTQQDVIDGLVVYVHTATGADQNTQDGFAVQINDGATPSNRSDTATITLNVTPLNQAPTVSGSGNILEGQPANALEGGNPASVVGDFIVAEGGGDDADGVLTVRLTSLPTDGTLFYTGTVTIGGVSQTVTNRAVTQADIDAGFVFAYSARSGLTYGNAGNRDSDADPATGYPFADGFGVTISDGGGGAGAGAAQTVSTTITLNIRPTDDDPALDPASSLQATVTAPGDGSGAYTVTLTMAMLNALDVDSSDDRLTIAVVSQALLDQGRLLLNGEVLPNGATFTVADVKAGRVQYVQQQGAGPNQTDSFQFQVRDNTTSVRWNADGTRIQRDGGDYDDNGTPGNYNDDSLQTFSFTINLVETPDGNGGPFPDLDNATTHADSNYAGTDATGVSRGNLTEGGTIVLAGTGSNFSLTPGLSYTADGVPPEQVVYTVLGFDGVSGGGWNGVLQRYDGSAWVNLNVFDTFTQADLNANSIRFVHDGASEDFESSVRLSASAGVLVDDGAGGLTSDSWVTSFSFYATPVNDAPVTVGSSNTVIPEGEMAYITTGQLQISDPDDAVSEGYLEGSATLPGGGDNFAFNNAASGPGALQFQVLTLPPGGTLQYSTDGTNWINVSAGQFIDAALITGAAGTTGLRFVSDGSEMRNTSFDVRAVDRWGATSNTATVGIQITNLNDAPQIAPDPTQADPETSVNNPLTVAEGGYAQISTAMLSAFDSDSTTTQVQYTITGAPAHGSIAYSTDGVTFLRLGVGSSFSEADVLAGRIYYLHGGDESDGATYPNPPSDSFTFSLGDGDKEQPGNQFWIYVTPANDAPVVTAPAGPIPVDSAIGANNPVPGFSVADGDLDTPTAAETDFVQVTVRLLDAGGTAFNAGAYAGVTIGSTSLGGVTVDGDKNGAGDFLTLRGTRAQVNAALAGLTVTFGDDRDAVYQVQVIADDRLRDAGGALVDADAGTGGVQPSANGGPVNESDPAGSAGIAIPATEYNWYSATVPTAGAITGNLSAASVRIFASSENDPATLTAPPAANVIEDQASYIGGSFVVSDPESAAFDTPITVRLAVPSGTLGVGGAGVQGTFTPSGGEAVTIAGDGTGLLVLTGRASDIQALLNSGATTGLTYRSAANVNHDTNAADAGDVTLTVSFDDTGSTIGDDTGTGSVANNPPAVTMALTIAPVNDAPTVSLGGGVTPGTPLVLTGGATPTPVPGFVVGDIDVDGDIAGNGAASDVTDGESDFLQVTVRITDATGNALPATSYDGTNGNVTITSSAAGSSGVAIDATFDGTGSALVISGTRAQVQAYLDGLAVALSGDLANGDQVYRVEVIADDRLRDGGGVVTGANGGLNNDADNDGTVMPPATPIDPYAATPGGLASNVASTYRTLFPSSINDPAHIAAGNLNVNEGGGSVTISGITVTDQDALDASFLATTVSVPEGFTITGIGAGTGGSAVILGDGLSVTITGTLAEINSRINTIAVRLPDAPGDAARTDWNGAFTVTVVVDDEGNTGGRPAPGTLAPGDNSTTGTFTYQDEDGDAADLVTTRTFSFTVNPVNDAPGVINANTETLAAVNEDVGNAAAGAFVGALFDRPLFDSHFADATDLIDNSGSGTGGSTSDSFFGVAITGLALNPAQGEWQYSLDGSTWTAVGARSDANALVLASNAQLRFVPAADFHGTPNALTMRLVETDANGDSATPDPASGSTVNVSGAANGGTTVYSAGTVVLSTSVANVNDRPTAIDAVLTTGVEDQQGQPAPAATAASLFGGAGYGDATDNQSAIAGGGNAATAFGGIAIVGNAATAAEGSWQYSTDTSWTAVPSGASDGSALLLPPDAQLRFVPAANYNGVPGSLTVRVSDAPVGAGTGDISATVGDPTSRWSATHTLSTTVAPRNDAPVLAGTPTNATATENGQTGTGDSIPAVSLLSGAGVSDLDLATTPGLAAGTFGAGSITVGFDGYQPGDLLFVDPVALPAGATVSGGNGVPLVVQFDADTTLAEVQAVLNALAYRSTSDNPTNYGADTDRVYTIVINDGNNVQAGGNAGGPALDSNVLTGTLTIVVANDPPTANDDTHSIGEDTVSVGSNVVTGRLPAQGDTDPDNTVLTVTSVRTGAEAGTGTVGSVGSPLAGSYGSVVLNADGSYTYTLDNADPRVQALTAGETLTEVYTYAISDGAGGTDIAQLTITITGAADGGPADDQPGIVANDQNGAATGHLSVNEAGLTSAGDTSETAGSTFAISAADGLSAISVNGTSLTLAQLQAATPGTPLTITTADGVLSITGFTPTSTVGGLTTAGQVSYTYTLTQRQDHSGGEVTDPFALTVTDRDGDVANGTLTVLIVDDVPLAANDANSITEDAAPNTVTGDLKINDRNGADDGNGVPVSAVSFGATAGTLGNPLATAYGSIVVNADGSYTYTLDNNNATVNALTDGQTLTETLSYTIVDADGDTSTATLTITINGRTDAASGPSIVPVDGNGAAAGQTEVHESGLTDGAGGADPRETSGGTIAIEAADGLSSVTVGGTTLTVAQLQALGTTPVTIDTGEGTLVLTSFTATSSVGGVPTAGELSYTYTLKNPIDQPGATESFDPVALQVNDAGGGSSTGTLLVRIVDDVPLAANDAASITEDAAPSTVSGAVKANDANGADDANGVPVTGVSFGGTAGSLGSPLAMTYGSIVVNADGSYTYTLDNANPAVQRLVPGETLNDTVSYTIVDADGDTSTATITITIGGANDGVTLELIDGNGPDGTGQATVSERGLGDGGDPSETTTGRFVVRTPDGLGSIDVGGTTLTPAQLANLGTAPVTIVTDKGVITLTGYDPATGAVSYSYTLTERQPHGGGEVTDDIAVTVRDRDGDSTTGTLRVLVIEDVPTARDDAASVDSARPGATSVGGNVFGPGGRGPEDIGDRIGADFVAKPVTGFSFEGRPGVIGGAPLAGAYGALQLNADGSYSYAVDVNNSRVASLGDGQTLTEVFSYTITDADGSTSTAQLVVTIRGASQFRPLTGDQIFPIEYPSQQRYIAQGMAPALFVELSVQESQRISQEALASIASRVTGGAYRSFDDSRLYGIGQDMSNIQHVSRDGVSSSLRLLQEMQQTLALRGLDAGLPVGDNALFGDFSGFGAPWEQPVQQQSGDERIVVPGAKTSAAPLDERAQHAEAIRLPAAPPSAGDPAQPAEAARSFSSRLAASAGERGTVRDVVRVQQREAVRVKVPAAQS